MSFFKNLYQAIKCIITLGLLVSTVFGLLAIFGVGEMANTDMLSVSTRYPIVNVIIEKLGFLFFSIFTGFLFWLVIYYWWNLKHHRCSSCGKWFQIREIGKQIVDKEETTVTIRIKKLDRDGKLIGYDEQEVPGEKITYHINYKCKNCGKNSTTLVKKKDEFGKTKTQYHPQKEQHKRYSFSFY